MDMDSDSHNNGHDQTAVDSQKQGRKKQTEKTKKNKKKYI